MLTLIWLAALVLVALSLRHRYGRFRCGDVRHQPPLPLLGNSARIVFGREHIIDTVRDIYDAFPEDRFVGHFQFLNPITVIRDLVLIKQIAVKDFDYFTDHSLYISEDSDPFLPNMLFFIKGSKWRDMRSTLSPAFTISKIRLMVPFMVEVGNQMNQVLKKKIKASEGHIDIDIKDLTSRYSNDVIASCAFGLKINSHADERNEFYVKGIEAITPSFWQTLKFISFSSLPVIMNMLKLSLFPKSTIDYFRALVANVMSNRIEKNIIRPDMIHLLMEVKKGYLKHDCETTEKDAGFATVKESKVGLNKVARNWSDDELTAQALLFFIGGFDTVSGIMIFLLYELACNPEIQDKLVTEILETDFTNGGKLVFDSIQHMNYLDMVLSESLRKWPSAVFALDRLCVKDYNLGRANSQSTKDYIIRKGEAIWLPIWAIHRDPQYYPDPDKFDPERFSEENKHNIKPFTFMPFGVGPRNCIGSRFALCEIKLMVYQLLKEIEVSPCGRTCVPAQIVPDFIKIRMKGGAWLRFSIRK